MARASSSSEKVDQSSYMSMERDSDSSATIRQGHANQDVEKRLDDGHSSGGVDSPDHQKAEVAAVGEAEDAGEYNARETPPSGLTGVLSRVISRASTVDAGPPPDGGIKAWIIGEPTQGPSSLSCYKCS
jgi:hypothetical protein